MDFFKIKTRTPKRGIIEVYPDFVVGHTKDLMVRGKSFYAIWNEETNKWSTDEIDVARIVDRELQKEADKYRSTSGDMISVKTMGSFSSNSWKDFKKYLTQMPDNSKQLDTNITFMNDEINRNNYVSKTLPYSLEKGDYSAYNEIMNTLYAPEERYKIEWAIGAIINGDAKKIQKFLVFYGDPGSGKSTVLNIVEELFSGYYTVFDAKSLTSNGNSFSTEQFKDNPLIAIQHDGDLSRIEDNTKLNSIVSHETININEKYKSSYPMKMNAFLFMATNKPVKITDGKAGLIRRLIDVRPTGNKLPARRYNELVNKVNYELGAIAYHCLEVYESMGPSYYNTYRPVDMMYKTDPFFNFVENYYFEFSNCDGISLKQAYKMYKEYCEESGDPYSLQMYKFREELKNYFRQYDDVKYIDRVQVRSWYSEFDTKKFDRKSKPIKKENKDLPIVLDSTTSLLDKYCKDCPAQYATSKETPKVAWDKCDTILSDIDTSKLHYVRVPENHIVLDFDLRDESGNKSLEKNLEAAAIYPPTYTETSKSGNGLHLHYLYNGDVTQLANLISEGIEVKVFTGKSSLRRKLIKCNNLPIATISSGLPLKKGDNKVVDFKGFENDQHLRAAIAKLLRKENVATTFHAVKLIKNTLDEAYNSGMSYNVENMRSTIEVFAMCSSNHSDECLKIVDEMKFKSKDYENEEPQYTNEQAVKEMEKPIAFYDVEVFPNLFLVNWKLEGDENPVVRMINPKPHEVEELVNKHRLIGFNCRRYDNHIMYACMMGYDNKGLYELSKRIVSGSSDCFFSKAYNLSYTDVYDYSSKKQSLKKFEIELGLHHQELGLDWNEPVPKERWAEVAEYCDNDVISTEKTHEARKADFLARQILVSICRHAGIDACENDTTNTLTTKIIFGKDRKPDLVYTDLATGKCTDEKYQRDDIKTAFPGYTFENMKNTFMGEDVGFGGYVYAEPGIYGNVALLDVASMHPHSILAMNCFGKYTKRFEEIVQARILIKHKEFDKAKDFLDGALAPYLEDEEKADALATALKIPINSVYGLTSAKFDNPFRDKRNANNIVALRGALMMIALKYEVQKRGFTVAHIKTDSIKIPDATPEIIQFVMDFGKQYGYTFEHEATYEKMCLVNDAVYIAKYKDGKHAGEWTATGTQFQVPYVFKKLFSGEEINFDDMCETKSVSKGDLYLDFNEDLEEDKHNYQFVGRVGLFCPIKDNCGGAVLYRYADDKYYAATGTKGYRWLEAEVVKNLHKEDCIDRSYYERLCEEAVATISQYGDFEHFINDKYEEPPFIGGKIVKGE